MAGIQIDDFLTLLTNGDTYNCFVEAAAVFDECDSAASRVGQAEYIITYYCPAGGENGCPTTNGSSHVRIHHSWSGSVFSGVAWTWTMEFDQGVGRTVFFDGEPGLEIVHVSQSVGQTVKQNQLQEDPDGLFGGGVTIAVD